jgi:hypothetical protein
MLFGHLPLFVEHKFLWVKFSPWGGCWGVWGDVFQCQQLKELQSPAAPAAATEVAAPFFAYREVYLAPATAVKTAAPLLSYRRIYWGCTMPHFFICTA